VSPRQQPEQQAPPLQRLRIRYAKTGRARFASHRDFSRAFERALRRAGVPMAYSSGFSPHPRISYANASPTGAATDAEYLEIGLARVCDPGVLRQELNGTLPDGMAILEVVEAAGGSLAEVLTASLWDITLADVAEVDLAAAVAALLASEAVSVQRLTRTGLRDFDARAPILALTVQGCTLRLLVAHTVPLVRPDDVVQALALVGGGLPVAPTGLYHRRAQGSWTGTSLLDPFSRESVDLALG
jgi:radical SAM-linked protein